MTFDDARRLGLELPGVVDSTSYGTPALKVGGRLLARHRPEIDALVVRIDSVDKELLILRDPDVYFTTPHYDGYPAVLVRLGAVEAAALRVLLEASHRYVSGRSR
jgi:hypothetical protein